jgi:hypothetical protein
VLRVEAAVHLIGGRREQVVTVGRALCRGPVARRSARQIVWTDGGATSVSVTVLPVPINATRPVDRR